MLTLESFIIARATRNAVTLLNALLFIFLFLIGPSVLGQTAANPDRGTNTAGSYAVSNIESVNLTNGNLNLAIPLASLPPMAGGKLGFTLNAYYNSKVWNTHLRDVQDPNLGNYVETTLVQSNEGGWKIGDAYYITFENRDAEYQIILPDPNAPSYWELNNYKYKMVLHMPDGSTHELRTFDYAFSSLTAFNIGYYKDTPWQYSLNTAVRYYTSDGSYIWAKINPFNLAPTSFVLYMPDGTKVEQNNGVQRIYDTNGNSVKIWSETVGSTYTSHYQDELTGREIKYSRNATSYADAKVEFQTVGGTWMTTDLEFGTTTVTGKTYEDGNTCSLEQWFSAGLLALRSITLPQTESGQPRPKFTFSYNSDTTDTVNFPWKIQCDPPSYLTNTSSSHGWGSLSRMVMPSGAIVNYAYQHDGPDWNQLTNNVTSASDEGVGSKTIEHDGTTDTWSFSHTSLGGGVTNPDGSFTEERMYPHDPNLAHMYGGFDGRSGLIYRTNQSNKILIERHWIRLAFDGANYMVQGGLAVANPVVDAEYTSLLDDTSGHNPVRMSAKTFQYDYNGNLLSETDYDWFDPSTVSRDAQGVPTGVPSGATVLRNITNCYYNQATASTSTNVYAKRALSNPSPLILNAPKETTLGPSITRYSYDGQSYGSAPTAGNLTTKSIWDNLDNKWITTSKTYDSYGNIATSTDARQKVTQFSFNDSTHALPTSVTVNPENDTGAQTLSTAYDFSTGRVTSNTDSNSQTTNLIYTNQSLGTVDPFGRPGIVKGPAIGGQRRSITTTYLDSARQIVVATDLSNEDDQLLKSRTTVDQLGRPFLSEKSENGTSYTLSSVTKYLNMGQVTLTSSPARSSASDTDSWTRITKDLTGRITEVATFGGATQPEWTGTSAIFTGRMITNYEAEYATVTDQAGKLRRSRTNALGQLVRVDEPDDSNSLGDKTSPVQKTDYAYDVFGNLTTVTQGTQTRSFAYDSVSRLRTSTNPESGATKYQYDDNGNLIVKSDARCFSPDTSVNCVSTHYEYDSINRPIRRWYNLSNSTSATTQNSPALPSSAGATDEIRFYYDTQSLPSGGPSYSRGSAVGRLVAQTYGGTSSTTGDYFAYDVLGRPTSKYQRTGSVDYLTTANYQLSGLLTSITYPSGNSVSYSYDSTARVSGMSGNLGTGGSNRTYSTGILYAPTGQLVKEEFGTSTPIFNKLFYNSRGQLSEIRESSSYTGSTDTTWDRGAIINFYSDQCWGMCSGSSMSDNNGSLRKQSVYIPNQTMRWQQYSYDTLNRLKSVSESLDDPETEQWKQSYTYDRWGNRKIDTNSANTYANGPNNQGFAVNKAFDINTTTNQLTVPSGQSGAMSYDAAGNLTNDTYTGAGDRTYDAEDRITSAWGGLNQAQLYKYDGSGQRIKRTVNGVETWCVYGLGGELLAEYAADGGPSSPTKEYGYRNGQLLVIAAANSSVSSQNVNWTNAVNVVISGNTITSNSGGSGWGNSGAFSSESISSGDGYVQFTAAMASEGIVCGLSHGDSNQDYSDIDFGIQVSNIARQKSYAIVENGEYKALLGSYASNDIFRIAVEAGVVKYYRNATLVYTSLTAPTFPLSVDAAIKTSDASISNVVLSTVQPNPNNVEWLVTDQLGTPRMVFDQTGNLANVKRHDYLPFGEELIAPVSGRTTGQGYSADSVRQQFTSKERDIETGLDYFGARYYASLQGRFTSPDPLLSSGTATSPQSWNRYNYCGNDPLNIIDPTGLDWWYLKDSDRPKPEWFSTDPGTDYRRWSDTFGYIYYDSVAKAWGVLDPNSGRAFITNTLQYAQKLFDTYFADGGKGVLTTAQTEFLAGMASGMNPIPFLPDAMYEKGGVDTSSRDYIAGKVVGAGLAGGLSMASATFSAGSVTSIGRIEVANEGIYEFTAASGKTYVGQSADIAARIEQHLNSGKVLQSDLSTVVRTQVLGGKTAREVAEQLRINALGGVKNLENIRNPIGKARQHLMN